jgi:uncharacterized protein
MVKSGICGFAWLTIVLLAFSSDSAAMQNPAPGPSFSCSKATTRVEKLICSDKDLSALDLEYSRLYNERLQESDSLGVRAIQGTARLWLDVRDKCSGAVESTQIRPYEQACLTSWYRQRISEFSDFPKSPAQWSPELIDGIPTYIDPSRSSRGPRTPKLVPDVYLKAPGSHRFFKGAFGEGVPQPARIDWSSLYSVYRNVLGSLTLVSRGAGDLVERYFFNQDGRLAAQERRFAQKTGTKATDIYVEAETVFYGPNGKETSRVEEVLQGGRIAPKRKDISVPPLEKPAFDSFAGLSDRFKDAGPLDPDKLGLCYLDLNDGYGTFARIVNFEALPLDGYEHSIPPVNYRGSMDFGGPLPKDVAGTTELLGSLGGKRVYSVAYLMNLFVIVVEREPDRYLPVLYVSPERKIDSLWVTQIEGRDVLFYSSTLSGTGNFVDEWYFVLDHGIPKSVEYRTALGEELKKILPEHYGIWKGGGFDLNTLTFSNSVWKDGDPNGGPSGGSVTVHFGFENGHFVVKSSKWDKPN